MRRLTVHVSSAKVIGGKIFNTLSFKINSDDDIDNIIGMVEKSGMEVTKKYTSNINK